MSLLPLLVMIARVYIQTFLFGRHDICKGINEPCETLGKENNNHFFCNSDNPFLVLLKVDICIFYNAVIIL